MSPFFFALLIGVGSYILIIALIPKHILARHTQYTRSVLKRLEEESYATSNPVDHQNSDDIWRERIESSSLLTRVFLTLPGARTMYPKMEKAGIGGEVDKFLVLCMLLMFLVAWFLRSQGIWSIVIAFAAVFLLAWFYINSRIKKRNAVFLNDFPDALDMIVRSVRSGYPLNAAVRMVAENMQPPISTEFQQVADETAYGSSLVDSLKRLAVRIDEPDTHFFVVVLSVQQEVGGNLAEVLSNLSNIIRKRKHLRMKVKAITSEGRATAWVLGLLPVFVFGLIHYVAPTHLEPLFDTRMGNLMLAFAIGIVLFGGFVVRKMSDIEV
ncbi:MAG: type II secretion system F family protein [Alphaproteobacteria bacterium]